MEIKMTLGNQLEIGDVKVNWGDAMNPFTYDETHNSNMFDASKTAHNQRLSAVEAHEKEQSELIALFEKLDDEEKQKQLNDIYLTAQSQFLESDEHADKVDCSVLKELFNDYLETATLPASDAFLTYLCNLDAETKAEIYSD